MIGKVKSVAATVSATVASLSLPRVSCTAPAFLKLTGDAMRHSPAPAPVARFDNFIKYTAVLSLDTTSVSLTTSEAAGPDTATSAATTAGALESSTANLSISLVRGNTLQAGHYASVLVVEISPQP